MSSAIKLKYWMRTRTRDQRILILISWFIVCLSLWYAAWESGYFTRQTIEANQVQSLQQKIASDTVQINEKQSIVNNPFILKKHQQMTVQLNDLNGQLQSVYTQLVSPAELLKAMQSVLEENSGLKLLELSNTGNVPLVPPKESGKPSAAGDVQLYRHNFTMVFTGHYAETMNYFKKIEKLPWKFYWDSVDYEVTKFPEAKITIKLHTISASQGVMDV